MKCSDTIQEKLDPETTHKKKIRSGFEPKEKLGPDPKKKNMYSTIVNCYGQFHTRKMYNYQRFTRIRLGVPINN